jgi:hypothetical protein
LDTPLVSAIKVAVDRGKNLDRLTTRNVAHEPDPTALTIPMDSIIGKPMESTAEERQKDEPVFE